MPSSCYSSTTQTRNIFIFLLGLMVVQPYIFQGRRECAKKKTNKQNKTKTKQTQEYIFLKVSNSSLSIFITGVLWNKFLLKFVSQEPKLAKIGLEMQDLFFFFIGSGVSGAGSGLEKVGLQT